MSYITDNESAFIVGEWLIEPGLNRFTHQQTGVVEVVTPKVMELCLYLSRAHPNALSQEDIASSIWPDRIISDSSIYQLVAQLRKALNDVTAKKQYVERVSGKGYRFLVKPLSDTGSEQSSVSAQRNATEQIVSAAPANASIGLEPKWIAATAVLLLLAGIFWFQFFQREQGIDEQQQTLLELKSIAVTPVQNKTSPKIAMLDNFHASLLEDLVKLPQLNVIYLRQNEQKVEADAELLTQILNDGNSLNVQLSLLNQQSSQVLWTKQFTRDHDDLLILQREASQALRQFLGEQKQVQAQSIGAEVYHDYILANYLWNKRDLDSLTKAKGLFERVLEEEPGYAPAMLGLCNTYLFMHIYGNWSENEAVQLCTPLISNAIVLEPNNGSIIATKALLSSEKDTQQINTLFQQAILLSPSYANGYLWYGNFLRQTGRYTEALATHQKALSLDPLSPIILRSLAYSHLNLRQLKEARYFYQRSLSIEPDYSQRPLEALDFLPLDVAKASAFLDWTKRAGAYLVNRPENKLTHALIQLSMGDLQMAKALYGQVSGQAINPAFHLYVGAAIHAAEGDNAAAQTLLKKRLALSSEINTFAMPYIVTLMKGLKMEQALDTFEQYFPDVEEKILSKQLNLQQSLLYMHLLEHNGQVDNVHRLQTAVDALVSQHSDAKPLSGYAEWLLSKGRFDEAKAMIERSLRAGWLPDVNDNIYAYAYMKNLFLRAGGDEGTFVHLVNGNRAKVISEFSAKRQFE